MGVVITRDTATDAIKKTKEALPPTIRKRLLQAAQHLEGEIRSTIMSEMRGRTGALPRSFRARLLTTEGRVYSAGVFSQLVYARIQNDGGVIVPKSVKNLAVPIMSGKNLPVGKWPRHFGYGDLQLIVRKGKPPLLAKVSKKRITPLFVLLKRVSIRGSHYLERSAASSETKINEILGKGIEADISKQWE